ncbi:hypothetical protein [Natronorubrum sp. FCH18a]|uniref:hypothetical protein n=1 Tax=Natronorubrum sp. FCH18a TaxID=3447018 RepID=UPI003F51A659
MAEQPAPDVGGESATDKSGRSIRWKMLVVAVPMGVIIGGLLALVFSELGGSIPAFFVGFLVGSYYLYRKPLPTAAIGTGLYISAALLVLYPIFHYVPMLLGADESTAEGAGTFIGSIIGLLLWGFVSFLIGLVIFAAGYFLNRRARRKLDAQVDDDGTAERGADGDTQIA